MTKEKVTLAVLFADIARSTQLYEALGDREAQELVGHVLSKLGRVALSSGGTVVKNLGDAVMCTFGSADRAVAAARSMHEAMEAVTRDKGGPPVNIHVGIHLGPVIRDGEDVFGDAVNVASRMVDMAKPRQILATEETVSALTPGFGLSAECIDKTTIKGRSGEINIYELFWEQHDVTVIMATTQEAPSFSFRLELRLGNKTVRVDQTRPTATLGRQDHNDLVVDDSRVSRSHARVEYRRGRYVLVDQSSNGTCILARGGKTVKVNRDEAPLIGDGVIALGRYPDPDSPDMIHYVVQH